MTTEPKLTIEQLDSLNDREIDALVVEMITHESTCPWHGAFPADDVPLYSSDASLAGLLLNMWCKDNKHCDVLSTGNRNIGYTVTVYTVGGSMISNKSIVVTAHNNSSSRAICTALILAEQEKS